MVKGSNEIFLQITFCSSGLQTAVYKAVDRNCQDILLQVKKFFLQTCQDKIGVCPDNVRSMSSCWALSCKDSSFW